MMLWIAVVVGALIGAVASGEAGALAGALFGWLVVRSLRQQREIDALRRRADEANAVAPVGAAAAATAATPARIAELDRGAVIARVGDTGAGAAAARSPDVDRLADIARAAQLDRHEDVARTAAAERHIDVAATNSAASPPPILDVAGAAPHSDGAPAAARARATIDGDGIAVAPPRDPFAPLRAWLFGGNTIVKAGIGILFIGLAFLAKYASEHAHLSVEWRLAAIGAAAVALLAFGWRLRSRRPEYAQVLQGGAVAVLYLTLFAAFRFYGVLDAVPAFVLMVAVAALAAALAVLQDARALALVGALGGFATPIIVSTGSGNHVALFSYYLVLDAGIALVAWWKTWRLLNVIGFVATFLVATAWGVLQYRPDHYASSQVFLVAFFLLFVAILVLPARRLAAASTNDVTRTAAGDGWVNSSLLFGLPTVVFALEYGLVRDAPYGAALAALALAAFYVLLASWMRRRPELGITFEATLAIAIVFLTLVIPFALDARSTAGAWTLEGAGLVWVGFRQRRGLPRAFGYALLTIAGLAMLLGHQRHGAPGAVFNVYLFNGVMAAAASLAAALFVDRARTAGLVRAGEEACAPLLVGFATLWLAATAAIEIDAFVPARFTLAAVLVSASVVAALYALLARRLGWQAMAWPALAHAPIAFLLALADAALLADPSRGGGWWAWPLAFAAHALVLRWAAPVWPRAFAHAVHALGALTLALLGALLGRAATAPWGDAESAWPWLGWLAAPAVLLLLLARPQTMRVWPMRAEPSAYRTTAAAVLAAALWLWTLVANVASDGTAAPLPHVPFVNPLDVGIAVALAATLLWLRRSERIAPRSLGFAAAAGFVWLNAIVVRGFHHYAEVPYRFDAWLASLPVQTGITLLWTAIALVARWLAAARAARSPWVAGAALLAAVVLKLLLVDLSGSGSVTRIVSFIGVGVLMLVIGYVAPLPAKEERRVAA
jgi:uncharacterized membrane protein